VEIKLKYGNNPHQEHARICKDGDELKVLNGKPGFINLLDAFGAWQLARELKEATGLPGAASFKHVSPAGAAIARPIDEAFRKSQMVPDEELSPVATAYVRARGGDRMCSFGDVAAVSEVVDITLARILNREVSDCIIAPGYEPDALELLMQKKKGGFLILEIDADYEPSDIETRDVFGFTMEQTRNKARATKDMLKNVVSAKKDVPDDIGETLLVATIALKYAQSNSVCLAYDGQVIGMGAGQQSRVHCTRLACDKAEKWLLQQHPRVLELKFKEGLGRVDKTNVVDAFLLWDELSKAEMDAMLAKLDAVPEPLTRDEREEWIKHYSGIRISADALFTFRDSIDRASRTNVQYVLQPGNSLRDDDVTQTADDYGMVMIHSGIRWFLH